MEKFEIKLKSDNNIFTSGETVFGHIFMLLKNSIKARSIRIKVSGKANSKWDYYNPATKVYISCRGEDSYINADVLIWDGQENEDSFKPGIYEFPFNFTIPERCPPSFEGDHGKIQFFCKAVVDRPWHIDNKAEIRFIVKPQFDLNHIPGLGNKVVGAIDENLGAIFFKHGKVDAKVMLHKRGYIIGETITPNISITNSSSRAIQKIDVALIQFITYTAKHGGIFRCENGIGEPSRCHQTKRSHRNIVEHKTDLKIAPHSFGNHTTSITVPEVATSFSTSPIMKIEYFVKVTLVAEGLVSNSVSVEIPIVIGTIPVEENPATSTSSNSTLSDPPPPYDEFRKISIG